MEQVVPLLRPRSNARIRWSGSDAVGELQWTTEPGADGRSFSSWR